MVYNRAPEVAAIILQKLDSLKGRMGYQQSKAS